MSDAPPTPELPVSKRSHWFRRIRIAISVFFGLLTVALCVLWVRRYWSNGDATSEIVEAIKSNRSSVIFDSADQVVIVRPYTDLKSVTFDDADSVRAIDSAISHSDGINLLVLIDSDTKRVLAWADVPRNVIDFRIEEPSQSIHVDQSHRHWVDALKAKSQR